MKSPERLLSPAHLYSRAEVLERPGPVPRNPGVYAWYFREVPGSVALEACHVMGNATLLYVGIAPRFLREGLPASRQTLRTRLRYHYRGNAEGSTLRLTLGCLLADTLGLDLRRVGSGKRLTFGPGEAVLSAWMGEHAFVTWVEHSRPWELEDELIRSVALPLNLQGNTHHPFAVTLARIRAAARERARCRPVLLSMPQ